MEEEVIILATRTCHHRPYLEKELARQGIPFQVFYTDERPDLVARWGIHHSPVLLFRGKPVFVGMPGGRELEAWIAAYRSGSFKHE